MEIYQPKARDFVAGLLILFLLLVLRKAWLLYGWMLPGSAESRLRRSYIAILAMLHDLGYRRDLGETRLEFQKRVSEEFGAELLRLTEGVNRFSYSSNGQALAQEEIDSLRDLDLDTLASLPLSQRFVAFINPSSAVTTLMGAHW
jgi:hypothetical protein